MPTTRTSDLEQWLAAEAVLRESASRGPGPGIIARERALSMDGLSLMQAMMRGEVPTALVGHAMDFILVEAERGRAVFQGAPSMRFGNPLGGLHGGWYATMLDSALGCAVHTMMPAGRAYTTAELSVNLVRAIPLGPDVQRVRAEGQVIHCGRQLATAQARLVGPDGTLYAHGTTTCLVFDLPAASKPASA